MAPAPKLLGEAHDQAATEAGIGSLGIDSLAVIGDRRLVYKIALSMSVVSASRAVDFDRCDQVAA
jgi:hypothetical protein